MNGRKANLINFNNVVIVLHNKYVVDKTFLAFCDFFETITRNEKKTLNKFNAVVVIVFDRRLTYVAIAP